MDSLSWQRIPAFDDNYIWLLEDKSNQKLIAVDPGSASEVIEYLKNSGKKLTDILITHHHWDHIGGVKELTEKYSPKVYGSQKDCSRLPKLDQALSEGDSFEIGNFNFKVFEADGHTNGHILFFDENLKWLFCGDTLFAMGCGKRFEGTGKAFHESLEKIKRLPKNTLIFCAHEYTLSNARFAEKVEPNNQKLKERKLRIEELRSANKPTVPFILTEELDTNPFLRVDFSEIKKSVMSESGLPFEVFTKLRELKDRS